MPTQYRQITLLLRADCLFGAAETAFLGGDSTTAVLMMAQAKEALREARELAEKARNQ